MTHKQNLTDRELDELFASEAAQVQHVPDDLQQRILADADRILTENLTGFVQQPEPQSEGIFASILNAIGGWPAMTGLATATVAGLWIGFLPTDAIGGFAETYLSDTGTYDMGDLMPTIDYFLDEG